MKAIYNFLPLIIIFILNSCIRTNNSDLTFLLEQGKLDGQSEIPTLEGSLRFYEQSLEDLSHIPEDLSNILFASIHTSRGSDSLTTIISGESASGQILYKLDANNNEDFSDDPVLIFKDIDGILTANQVIISGNDDASLINDPTELTILQRKPGNLEYHFNELWLTHLVSGREELEVAAQRFAPDVAFLFIDVNQNNSYDKIFFPGKEKLALDGRSFTVNVDFKEKELLLTESNENPVDKGFRAPFFEEEVWNSDLNLAVGLPNEKLTLLVFWSPFCEGSRMEAKQFNQLKIDLTSESENLRFIAVTQNEAALKAYLNGSSYDYSHIISRDLWNLYAVTAPFASFVIDRDGIIRQRYFGYDEKLYYNGGNSGGGGGAAGRIRVNTRDASSMTVEGVVSPSDITGLFTWGRVGVR